MQKTAYEMRISDWSSDVCSSDLAGSSQAGKGSIAVDGDGSTLLAKSLSVGMQIGRNGPDTEGSLAITNGGQVELHGIDSVDVNVGREAGAEGTLTVDGAGSRLFIHSALDPRLRLGRDGTSEGHATLQNGGEIEILGSRALLAVGRDGADGKSTRLTSS